MQPNRIQTALLDNMWPIHLLLTIPYSHIDNCLAPVATRHQSSNWRGKNKTPLTNLKAEIRVKVTEHLNHTVGLNPG